MVATILEEPKVSQAGDMAYRVRFLLTQARCVEAIYTPVSEQRCGFHISAPFMHEGRRVIELARVTSMPFGRTRIHVERYADILGDAGIQHKFIFRGTPDDGKYVLYIPIDES